MAAGADKRIAFSPPGSIGLPSVDAVVLLRFDETANAMFPADSAGNLLDLRVAANPPTVVDAALGRGRFFESGDGLSYFTNDIVPGSTLLTRDMSIQVVISGNGTSSPSPVGTVVSRGLGNSTAERLSYALEITNVAFPILSVRWLWQDVGGTLKTQTGAQFVMPPSGFTMLTATRRWISPTSVLLRYYIGDTLIGEVASVDGSIGGGTTGTFCVATRFTGGAFSVFLDAVIDELLVLDHEITREEIEATWLRLSVFQPLGHQLFTELHDKGFPLPLDPSEDAALETRLIGHALGYAAAQIENFRANALPGRSYGTTLDGWATATQPSPSPSHDVDTRRARVVARMRQRAGSSIPGLQQALAGLVNTDPVANLNFFAFDNTVVDTFGGAVPNPLRWDVTPLGSWVNSIGGMQTTMLAGSYLFDGASANWRYLQMATGGDGKQAHAIGRVVLSTPQANLEGGLFFADRASNNYLLLGIRDAAGAFQIVTESFTGNVSHGVVVQTTLGANPGLLFLHLFQTTTDGIWQVAWSTTAGGTTGFTLGGTVSHPTVAHWSGIYARSFAAIPNTGVVFADDFTLRSPFGTRPLNAYVQVSPAAIAGGAVPDVAGSHSVIQAIKHAFVLGTLIIDTTLKCDDANSGCDRGPMGCI